MLNSDVPRSKARTDSLAALKDSSTTSSSEPVFNPNSGLPHSVLRTRVRVGAMDADRRRLDSLVIIQHGKARARMIESQPAGDGVVIHPAMGQPGSEQLADVATCDKSIIKSPDKPRPSSQHIGDKRHLAGGSVVDDQHKHAVQIAEGNLGSIRSKPPHTIAAASLDRRVLGVATCPSR